MRGFPKLLLTINVNISYLYVLPCLVFSIFWGCSITSPLSVWLILELNIIIFILILFLDYPLTNTNSPIKYFIIQSVSSGVMVWGVIAGTYSQAASWVFISIRMVLKLGAAPLHFWYIRLVQKASWVNLFLLSTIQKILPLFFFCLSVTRGLVTSLVILSRFMGLVAFSQSVFKRILGYSRVFNLSFMLISLEDANVLTTFFLFYALTILGVVLWGLTHNVNVVHKNYSYRIKSGAGLVLLLISLGGVPPFLGFWAKLVVLGGVLDAWGYTMGAILLAGSAVMLVTYLYVGLTALVLKQSYGLWPGGSVFSNSLRVAVSSPIFLVLF